ncbi:restriction endonuclease subunit S [Moraxella sp. ZY21109]|uniref:restriction endonuclease subunit S n=1 Tax=Moraxella sp. ZY21109 TaxID=2911969 RepID=UPI003D7F069B
MYAWKQRKLGEIGEYNPNGLIPNEFFYVDLECVIGTELLFFKRYNKENAPSRAQRLAKKGDVFFQAVRPYQKNNYLFDLNEDNFIFSTGYIQIRPSLDSYFLLSSLQNQHFVDSVMEHSTGTSYPAINTTDFKKLEIFIPPTKAEQQAIGEFFRQLDDTIAFHQRTQKKYQNLKKSYLEKMFAKINYAWKQRKLGEVVFQIKSYSLSRNVETNKDTGFKYVHYGDIHRNIAKLLSSENNLPSIQKGNYEFLQKGDLVIADASEDYEGIGNSCLIDCFLSRNIVAGLHTIALRPTEVNSLFLYYLLHTDIFSQYGKVIATGTKVFGITAKNLLNFEFNLPSETEQQAIGEFFRQLDDTIAFHQRELEKYQQLKQVLLDQLFV